MTDFLDTKLGEIDGRMKELKPLVDEYRRLEVAKTALDGVALPTASNGGSASKAKAKTKAAARAPRKSTGKPLGRPKGSGTRGLEAVAIIKANPGITIPVIAEKMGIKQNYLYRVVPRLAEEGFVKRAGDGKGWEPVEQL